MGPVTLPTPAERVRLEPVTPELLAEVVRRIVAAEDPDKIILFGSHARGNPREYSDLDLFVIKPGEYDRLAVESAIYGLFWDMYLALDVFVRTPAQVERELRRGNAFIRTHVLGMGKVLYERDTRGNRIPGRSVRTVSVLR